jgi:threonylcarbamoyladenosine tRNA methylthiotransferase MtaB
MPSFRIITLGCKVNQYESDALAQRLRESGWIPATGDDPADVCIVNTCAVTGKAAMQARQAMRQAVRANPGARIFATGCYAEIEAAALAKIDGVEAVFGQDRKHEIAERILDGDRSGAPAEEETPDSRRYRHLPAAIDTRRTRPYLKIQDGCDAFCSYCIVPRARGRSRSLPMETVVAELSRFADAGRREVVLTGIHLGCWGLDLEPARSLTDLLRTVDALPHPMRIRLSSIEPTELSDDIIALVAASSRFCRHFHIPLQSGDAGILSRMRRPYGPDLFCRRVAAIRDRMPDAAIGADVLVGFPGEDAAAFENTCRLIETLPLSYLHVFPFSPRTGTPAARYPEPVPEPEKKARCRRVREIGRKKRQAHYRSMVGRRTEVLIENRRDRTTGLLHGLSGNYVPVLVDGDDRLREQCVPVTIERVDTRTRVFGRPTPE